MTTAFQTQAPRFASMTYEQRELWASVINTLAKHDDECSSPTHFPGWALDHLEKMFLAGGADASAHSDEDIFGFDLLVKRALRVLGLPEY